MAGRPPLRIGQHGRITRVSLGGGVWLARCKFRDSDGVVRRVERRGPADEEDKYGKLAEDALIEALEGRRPPSDQEVSLDTKIMVLVNRHIDRLSEDGRSPATISTYKFAAGKLDKVIAGVKVGEATPPRIDAAVRSLKRAHGPTMARQSRTILQGGLALAVMAGVLGSNPVREVRISSDAEPQGAKALTADELRDLLSKLRASESCRELDLADPVTVLIATGVRRSELLGLRWIDWNETAGTITVAGKVVRAAGTGLDRLDGTKSKAGKRTLVLPKFATDALTERKKLPFLGEQEMIFPSTNGKWRDPNNFGKQWRKVREDLGVPEVTTHSFRKSVADLIDDEGLSARIGADQLGHSQVSMTQNRYMTRGKTHSEVAALLDRAIKDE